MRNASPRCETARKFCLLCWLQSEKLVGFERGISNVVNEYHYKRAPRSMNNIKIPRFKPNKLF